MLSREACRHAGFAARLAVLFVVGAIALPAGCGSSGARTTSTTAPRVPKGASIFSAPLDGTAAGFTDQIGRDSGKATIHPVPGALELSVQPGGDAGRELDLQNGVIDYVAELDFSVNPGSQITFDLGMRWANGVGELLRIDSVARTVRMVRYDRSATQNIAPVSAPTSLPGLTDGQPVHLAAAVQGHAVTVWRDRHRIINASDPAMPGAGTDPGLDVYGQPGAGTVRILGVRLYASAPH